LLKKPFAASHITTTRFLTSLLIPEVDLNLFKLPIEQKTLQSSTLSPLQAPFPYSRWIPVGRTWYDIAPLRLMIDQRWCADIMRARYAPMPNWNDMLSGYHWTNELLDFHSSSPNKWMGTFFLESNPYVGKPYNC
jgi:hypothetical protein